MSRPYVNFDNPNVVLVSMKEKTGLFGKSKREIRVATRASRSTQHFYVTKIVTGGNSSVNGERFRYTVSWGD